MLFIGLSCYQYVINVNDYARDVTKQWLHHHLEILGADDTPKGSLLYWNNPLCVFITTYFLLSSFSRTCWYACDRSSLVNLVPPDIFANRCSIFCIGYMSNQEAWLTVILKSPQILTVFLSAFRTGTIGAALSANCIGVIMPCFWTRANSSSTPHCIRNRVGLANFWLRLSVCICILASCPFNSPRPSLNTSVHLSRRLLKRSILPTRWFSFQSNRKASSQLWPSKLGLAPFTTTNGKVACWPMWQTVTSASLICLILCPAYPFNLACDGSASWQTIYCTLCGWHRDTGSSIYLHL